MDPGTAQPNPAESAMRSNFDVRLSIVITNLNTRDFIRMCLKSFGARLDDPAFEVILVDNGSTDGSVEMTRSDYPAVKVLAQTRNVGFGKANNIGMRAAHGAYLLILNSDTEIQGDALEAMCAYMDEHPDAGALGPKLLNPDGTRQLSCRRFPSYRTALFHRYSLLTRLFPRNPFSAEYLMSDLDSAESAVETDWVSGAALLTRRETIEKVGLLDEDFFMFAEDVDWCYRMKQGGWRVVYLPTARIMHYIGRSTRKLAFRMTYERHRSMWLFYLKHYSRGIALLDVATWLGIAGRCAMVIAKNGARAMSGSERRA